MTMWWARWSIWIVGSAALTSLVVGNAFYQKKQFYPTVVYITKSKSSMAVMYAQALLFVILMGKLFRKLFFGQLRAAEFEHLVDRSWYAVTETCLAFTVFRDDFSPKFLALFTLLLFLKSFHWLAEERVDYMERSPVITWIFHVRVLSLLALLLMIDIVFVNIAYQSTITKGASVQLVFGFEYAILTTIVLNTLAKYVFHLVDMQSETPWENKAVFLLYAEVAIGVCKVLLYVVFIIIMIRIYTLPLFALRPTYLAMRSLKKALNDVIMSRRAINNMNNLYPDVTAEELSATDNVCIICREEMTGGAKKLPCNHIFHTSCLRSWFQRQQTCPTCRLNVLRVPAPAPQGPAAPNPMFGQGRMFRAQPPPQPPFAGMGLWGVRPDFQNAAQAQQQANQQPRAGTSGGAETSNANNRTNGNTTQADGGSAGQFQQNTGAGAWQRPPMPPFGFMPFQPSASADGSNQFNVPPMPFIPLVPPPPPLLQTTGLSDDELRRLEGTSREHVEARLQFLRNVQILLDSAVVQMQQYSAVVTNLNQATGPSSGASFSTTTNQHETNEPKPGSSQTMNGGSNSLKEESTTSHSSFSTAASSSKNFTPVSTETSPGTSSSDTGPSTGIPVNEQDELRKRRLQKFSQQNDS